MVQILLRTLCDAGGQRQFTDDEADTLLALSPQDIRSAYAVAARLSNIIDDADVDDAERNSAGSPASD